MRLILILTAFMLSINFAAAADDDGVLSPALLKQYAGVIFVTDAAYNTLGGAKNEDEFYEICDSIENAMLKIDKSLKHDSAFDLSFCESYLIFGRTMKAFIGDMSEVTLEDETYSYKAAVDEAKAEIAALMKDITAADLRDKTKHKVFAQMIIDNFLDSKKKTKKK